MTFKDPIIFLLIPIVCGILFFFNRRTREPSFYFPTTDLLKGLKGNWKTGLSRRFFILRWLAIILFILALARPRSILEETRHVTEGIDIVLAIDASGSMAAEDFTIKGERYNRLEVVKKVVHEFIKERTNDRIALVAFAARAYTVCPLTTDYQWVTSNLERVELGLLEDGTAVGSAIASSISRLEGSKAKSKVVILLTDGINNAGKIDPVTAAQLAQGLGVKIYTIGAGSKGYVPYPVMDFFGRRRYQKVLIELDEATLQEIARLTEGQYFRATDTKSLRQVYQEIDKLEKTEIEEFGYREYRELFGWFLAVALGILLIEIFLLNTILLRIP